MLIKELIAKVREIDGEAADYLKNDAPFLCSYHEAAHNDLGTIMLWRETKQGYAYWADIYEQLVL